MNPTQELSAYETVVLDRPRRLILSARARARFEEATGRNLLSPQAVKSLDDLAVFVWAMASEEDPAVTLDTIKAHFIPENLKAIGDFLTRAAMDVIRLKNQREELCRKS